MPSSRLHVRLVHTSKIAKMQDAFCVTFSGINSQLVELVSNFMRHALYNLGRLSLETKIYVSVPVSQQRYVSTSWLMPVTIPGSIENHYEGFSVQSHRR